MASVFHNGRIVTFEGEGSNLVEKFVDCMIIKDGIITYIGEYAMVPQSDLSSAASITDLAQKTVVPGFIDGHMHLLMLGQSLTKLDLLHCNSLEDIRATIKAYAISHPDEPRIMCKSWLPSMTNDLAHKNMLDDIDPRPIFIDSNGLHSTWCNTAALAELDIKDMPDPPGGTIHRDEKGELIGLLSEAANINLVWPYLSRVSSMPKKVAALRSALRAYAATGYTGLVEMAMDDAAWEALQALRAEEEIPMRISAYWLILPKPTEAEDLAQVDHAIEMARRFSKTTSPNCRIIGIKCITDGTVDTCTAALSETYGQMTSLTDPLWPEEKLIPVVKRAAAANMQIALHAIGDKAVTTAINVLRDHASTPGPDAAPPRHRIEHLELTTPEDAARLGLHGITSSIQPVHADPSILRAWPALIGPTRLTRAFAYAEFAAGGSVLSIGSDSPTAPFDPLANMYVATTRKTARAGELAKPEAERAAPVNEGFRLGLAVGWKADFCVVDLEWSGERLLEGRLWETWFEGRRVWRREGGV
ncbi:amidohydrolase 3 [Pseudovirgaria hyperparasitica]|uniref:Amidohydrolase 3 n=1 Tax=Pseudovirgaria hyperparasitica TaxID=470096 RepID=A0A6A6W613_9PEZI|nr:amidohydrolase 3 [Pseudovirgaria hyperparasitica]KAF2756501.1 amidohydrolase 3 [Pseudovirgaria hyperparasitica]